MSSTISGTNEIYMLPKFCITTCDQINLIPAIIPNGTVMELGVAYRVCQFLKIPVVTYEFSEQKQAMWLTKNGRVMRQDTSLLWKTKSSMKLTDSQKEKIETLISSRKNAMLFSNFSRQWQVAPSKGAMLAKENAKIGRP